MESWPVNLSWTLMSVCQELTMEEYSFLEEYGLADDDGAMESQTWSTGDDNGMGEEMEAAFEEFLRTQT